MINPLAFALWYRPVYNAYMKDSSMYFVIYFFFGGFHLLFVAYLLLGFMETGGGGIINMVDLYVKKHTGEAVVCTINVVFLTILFLFQSFLYYRTYKYYQLRGHSLQEARSQAFKSASSSETSRQVTKVYVHVH
eukprot:Pompholyxophrys_sp_v1_NODE_164_length_1418_cov_3.318415.p1 type:complete len:134 gc:universal NODE_164_length_1418_cov_3.318415:717-316(-)